jgi:TP901 family phage tail tape measure protein
MMADAVSSLQVVVEGKDETTRVLKGIESGIIRFVGAVSAALSTISVVVFPIKAAADFQKELLNVGKTTDFTNAQLETLGDGLKQLSGELNVSADDLAKIAAAGGQMGLGSEGVSGILTFTEAASRLASVLDISADESGDAIGRLTNIFKIAIRDAEQISSLLNEISNNSTAKGADLIDMVQRIGTAGGTLNIKQAAALAATGRDLGLTVETVGTSFNKIFLDLQSKATDIAPVLGMPVEAFADAVRNDGVGALKMYVSALSKMDNVQRASFAEQTTGGGRIFALVSSLVKDASSGFQLLNKHMAEAEEGYDTGTSAIKEQERVLTGLIAQGQILKNVFISIAESVGRGALPYITALTKRLQEWAKNPEVLDFFTRIATSIGGFADTAVRAISALTALSSVMGPLLTAVKLFLYYKIAGTVLGITGAIIKQGQAIAATTKAWYGLITANKETVTSVAKAARELEGNNAKALASGGTATAVAPLGKAATFLSTALAPAFALQDKFKQDMDDLTKAETLYTQRVQQRAKVLGAVRAEMQQITLTAKAQAQAAYDEVLAAGGTKKAATAAKKERAAELNLRKLNLTVADSNLGVAFDESIARRSANLKSVANQAKATSSAIANMGKLGLVLAAVRAGIAGVAAAAGAMATGFIAVAGSVAAVISLVAFFLDMFGMLDPVVAWLKSTLGIADSAKLEQQRQAADRAKALEEEKLQAAELSKVYARQKQAKEDAAKAGASVGGSDAILSGSLAKQISDLQAINGHYADLTFRAAEIAGNTQLVERQWAKVNQQLIDATKAYEALKGKRLEQLVTQGPVDRLNGKQVGVSEADVAQAEARITDLRASLELLSKARERFTADTSKTFDEMATVANEAATQAERLAPLYDAAGLEALKALGRMLEGQEALKKAKEEESALEGAGSKASATDEEKAAYLAAAEKVKLLTQELNVLQTAYAEVKLSSAGATVFMANAFPDAAKASVDKVRALVRILDGLDDGQNLALTDAKRNLDARIATLTDQLTKVEKARMAAIMSANGRDLPASTVAARETAANFTASTQSAPLKRELADMQAKQSQMRLEEAEARKLEQAYTALNAATARKADAGQGLVSNFATNAALKALTDKQVDAQRKVEEGAKFNAENIKRLYEEAKSALSSTVNDAKKEVASLGQYFASRNLTLKLANFDINQSRVTEQFQKFQNDILSSEQKRLTALGLSSDEISQQMDMLKESFAWSDKMRQSVQDEARQRMVIGEIQNQIRAEEEAIAQATGKALLYAAAAKEQQAKGNDEKASGYATQAKEEAEKAKIATEALTEKVREYKSEASKPITDAFGARFIVSDEDIKAVVEGAAKARVAAAQANETVLKQASDAAEKNAVDENARLEALKAKATEYQATLMEIAKLAPQLGAAQEAIASKVLGNTEGMSTVLDNLKLIATTDFRGLDQFQTVSGQAGEMERIAQSVKEVAQTYAASIVPVGASVAEVSQSVVDNLAQAQGLGAGVVDRLKTALASTQVQASVTFPDAVGALQQQLASGDIRVPITFTGGGAGAAIPKNAEGGPIRGPGSGTSDSILSWLSNGEYVSDASTTSFFGEDFFATLKSIARGGRATLGRFATRMSHGLRLPAFAGGGAVGTSMLGAGVGIASLMGATSGDNLIGRVAVDLNVGGNKVSLLGERGEVDRLVKALHSVNR